MRLDPANEAHAGVLRRLELEVVIWLVTVRADGQPQPSPVWFAWTGDAFLMYSQPTSRKLVNLEANARVALHLRGTETGDDVAIFEGIAELPDDVEPADRVPAYLEKYRERIAGIGMTPEGFAADYAVPILVRPRRARIW